MLTIVVTSGCNVRPQSTVNGNGHYVVFRHLFEVGTIELIPRLGRELHLAALTTYPAFVQVEGVDSTVCLQTGSVGCGIVAHGIAAVDLHHHQVHTPFNDGVAELYHGILCCGNVRALHHRRCHHFWVRLLILVVERHVKVMILLSVIERHRLVADADDLAPPEDIACLLVFTAEIGLSGDVGKVHGLTAGEVIDAPPVMYLHIVILGKEVTAGATDISKRTLCCGTPCSAG